jgi:pyruvate kinase
MGSSPFLIRRALSRCNHRDILIIAPFTTAANNIRAISADKLFKSRLNELPPTGCMTKLVCTIGPATESVEMINELVKYGMNVARLNFSHAGSDYSYPEQCLERIRAAPGKHFQCATGGATNEQAPLLPNNVRAILVDTKGPEIRTGPLQGGVEVANIAVGDRVDLTTRTVSSDPAPGPEDHYHVIQVDYHSIAKSLSTGKQALLDDGLIALEVVEADPSTETVICVALNGGPIKKNKGVNLPDTVLDLPALTEKDKRDLKWACTVGADFVAVSFIRTASNVRAVIAYLDRCMAEMPRQPDDKPSLRPLVISKIESKEGVDNFDEILASSDGVRHMSIVPSRTMENFPRTLCKVSDTFVSNGILYRLWLLAETLEWKFLTAKCLRLRR